MMTLVTAAVVQMNVLSYSGFMVEHLGVVDDKDKAGKKKIWSLDQGRNLVSVLWRAADSCVFVDGQPSREFRGKTWG